MPVLDVTKLKQDTIERLALLFDRLCETFRTKPDKEPQIREEIDSELEKVIGEVKV